MVAEQQAMTVGTVREGVIKTFLGGQPLNEGQIGLTGLHAILAGQVFTGADHFAIAEAVLGEHLLDNLRHRQCLKDAPVRAQAQTGQGGFDQRPVTGATKAAVGLLEGTDAALHMTHGDAVLLDGQGQRLIEHLSEIDGRIETGQFQLQTKRLGKRLVQGKTHHLEITRRSGDGKTQIGLARHDVLLAAGKRYRRP